MKILIVGSTSVVGLAAGRVLSQGQHEVYYAGRRNADYYLDLSSSDWALPENLLFDVVIHVAADFGGDNEEDIFRAEMVNALGTLKVCRLARQIHAQHLVVISTVSANYSPGDPYFSSYSLSKKHADELAMFYCGQFALPLTILRPSQIYDAESKCRARQRLLYLMIEQAMQGKDIVIYGKNDAVRNYIFIKDIAEIISGVVETKTLGLYNCSAKNSVRLSQIARMALDEFNAGGRVVFDVEKPTITDLKHYSGEDLYRKIFYEPKVSLAEGIRAIRRHRERL